MPFRKQPRYQRSSNQINAALGLVLNIGCLDQQSWSDKKGFDRAAVEILLVPSHCMMRAIPTRT
jgi:hypothetical protein